MEAEKVVVSVQVLNDILGYLDTKPHQEVRRLVDNLQSDVAQNNKPEKNEDAKPAKKEKK